MSSANIRWPLRILFAAVAAILLCRGDAPSASFGILAFIQSIAGLRPRPAFWLALPTGTLAVGLAISWLFNVFPGATPVALFVIFGFFYGLFAAVMAWIAPRIASLWLRAFWIAAWWTAVEYFRCEWFTLRFPWITPGVVLGPTWLTPVVGVYGQSFLLVFAVALATIGPATSVPRRFNITVKQIASIAVIWPLLMLLSFHGMPLVEPRDPIRIAAVQFEECDFDEQFSLTRAATNSPQLVVWPETAILTDPRKELRRDLLKLVEHAERSNAVFAVGCYTTFGSGPRDWFNTALVFDGTGVLGEHHKNRPVHFFNEGKPGTDASSLTTPLGNIATPICFDCDYTEICRQMADDGAEFFAVPSRDPSTWGDRQRGQHARLFQLRAAECGRWFVVASAAGITQIIDPNGNVCARLPPYKPGILCGKIGRESQNTFYIHAGWMLPWLITAFAAIATIRFAFAPRPPA